ncbi:MAG: hypothetical protein H6710_11490 [Myxococcales bacterium]|nr:hypothetical protein [Myxococcales bacterium]
MFNLVIAAALVLGACSKSVEGETKKWTANTTKVSELEAQYPGLKPALEARKASAQKIYDDAAKLDGDAKIEKLAEANRALMTGFVDDLDDLDDKMKRLREARVEAASMAGDESSRLGAKVAAVDAEKALERAEAALKTGASDEASAAAVLKKVVSDIDTAQTAVNKVISADQAKKSAADAEKKAAEAKVDDAKAADEAKVAPWKCGYCDAENPHDAGNCNSCGAPRSGDKKPEGDAEKK